MTVSRSRVVGTLLVAAGLAVMAAPDRSADRLAAGPNDPYQDTDGDLLPDTLEWALMSDPWNADTDGDGDDDFLETVQFQLPRATPAPPMDHEFRCTTHIVRLSDNSQHVIVSLLFRVASGQLGDVTSLVPFIDVPGSGGTGRSLRVPFSSLFLIGLQHIAVSSTATEGLYLMLCSRLCSPEELGFFLPCSIGATAVIGQRSFNNGSVLEDVDGAVAAVVEIANAHFSLHPIDSEFLTDPNEPSSGFWHKSKVCEMELSIQGSGGGYALAQVVEAACTGAPTLGCAPSCDAWTSRLIVIPDSLGFLTGN